jgi:hypothetical protein
MTDLPDRMPPGEQRASDSDRDQVAAILREAAGDGRLTLDELDERLSAVYAAKTYAELQPITRDLPTGATPAPTPAQPPAAAGAYTFGGEPTSKAGVAIMGGFSRKGRWGVPRRFTAVAFWGGGEIDLREARFTEREVTISAWAIMGGVAITVPKDAEVIVNGIGIMGGFDHSAGGQAAGAAGAPRIVVNGLAFWGGVAVERKPTKAERRRLREERGELGRQERLERGREYD